MSITPSSACAPEPLPDAHALETTQPQDSTRNTCPKDLETYLNSPVASIPCPKPPMIHTPRPLTKALYREEERFHRIIQLKYWESCLYELVREVYVERNWKFASGREEQHDSWRRDLWEFHEREMNPPPPPLIQEKYDVFLQPSWLRLAQAPMWMHVLMHIICLALAPVETSVWFIPYYTCIVALYILFY